MKKCYVCEQFKDELEFYKDASKKDGIAGECKFCCLNRVSIYQKINREEIKIKKRRWVCEHPKLTWCQNTIHGHKRRGYLIKISSTELYELIKNVEYCELCDEKLNWEYGNKNGVPVYNSPSLDRKNNENYVDKNNIMILCNKCNSTKLNRTFKEFVEYCKDISEKFGDI